MRLIRLACVILNETSNPPRGKIGRLNSLREVMCFHVDRNSACEAAFLYPLPPRTFAFVVDQGAASRGLAALFLLLAVQLSFGEEACGLLTRRTGLGVTPFGRLTGDFGST